MSEEIKFSWPCLNQDHGVRQVHDSVFCPDCGGSMPIEYVGTITFEEMQEKVKKAKEEYEEQYSDQDKLRELKQKQFKGALMMQGLRNGELLTQDRMAKLVSGTFLSVLIKQTDDGDRYPETNKVGLEFMKYGAYAHIVQTGKLLKKVNGVYTPHADDYIKQTMTKQLPDAKNRYRNEVVSFITDSTACDLTDFDADKRILNCKNTFLNIDTLETVPHDTDYKSLIQIDTEYKPELGESELFLKILKEACPDYWELILQLAACALSRGLINPELCIIFVGDGNNAKSTIILALKAVFGAQNVSHISLQYLQKNNFAAFGLVGKMMNLYHDLPDSELKHLDKLKPIISQEPISVEQKGRDAFDAVLNTIMFYSTNEMPALQNLSKSILKRFNVIPFRRQFEKNDKIKEDLATPEERSRILNTLLRVFQEVKDTGLTKKQDQDETAHVWKHNSDSMTAFVVEYISPITEDEDDLEINPKFQQVYTQYIKYCHKTNQTVYSDKRLSKTLTDSGYQTYTGREDRKSVVRVRCSMKILNDSEPADNQTTL